MLNQPSGFAFSWKFDAPVSRRSCILLLFASPYASPSVRKRHAKGDTRGYRPSHQTFLNRHPSLINPSFVIHLIDPSSIIRFVISPSSLIFNDVINIESSCISSITGGYPLVLRFADRFCL